MRPDVDARVRGPDHATMQHAGNPDVVHIAERAGGLGRDVGPRHRAAHDPVGRRVLDRLRRIEAEDHPPARDEIAVGHKAVVGRRRPDHPVVDRQGLVRKAPEFRRLAHEIGAGAGRGFPKRDRRDLYGLARDGTALVGNEPRVAQHHVDAADRDVEFLGHDLGQRGSDAGAEIDMAVVTRDPALAVHSDEALAGLGGGFGRGRFRLLVQRTGAMRRPHDQQNTFHISLARHADVSGPASSAAARCTAFRISMWVPQRQRL